MTTARSPLPRLSAAHPLPAAARPPRRRTPDAPGILHIGLGAFHRAHQAVHTEQAMAASGDDRWQILGVSPRSTGVVEALRRQDGHYTVLERDGECARPHVVGTLTGVAHLPTEPERILGCLAAPTTRIVTLTVTEKGYGANPRDTTLRVSEEIRADAAGRRSRTVVGLLVRGLQRRAETCAEPIALASCDNLPANGEFLAGLVRDFVALLPEPEAAPLREFLAESVRFPSSVVDRIVPATTREDHTEVEASIGARDLAVVRAEPFTQWVMTDAFPAGRPAWERSGAVVTTDIEPFEQAKLRVLNGTHSALAYLGGLAGYATVAEAVTDPRLAAFAHGYQTEEVLPTLRQPPGADLHDYAATVLRRFANPALGHRTAQVAADGSQKIPVRLTEVVRHHRTTPWRAALIVAAWWHYTTGGVSDDGTALEVSDPLAAPMREHPDPRAALEWTAPALAGDDAFVATVRHYRQALATKGVLRLLGEANVS